MELIIKILVNIIWLIFLFIFCYPTYKWFNDLQIKNKIPALILSILIFIIIFYFLDGIRTDVFDYFNVKYFGVEY